MPALTRRGLLVLGSTGAAGAVLAACGSEEERRTESGNEDLVAAALAAETALENAYSAAGGDDAKDAASVLAAAARASGDRLAELESLAGGGGAADADAASGSGLDGVVTAADAAIAAYRQGAGLLTESAQRSTMASYLAQVAGELAAVRILLDEDPVPFAFVTGGSEEPYEVPEADEEEEE